MKLTTNKNIALSLCIGTAIYFLLQYEMLNQEKNEIIAESLTEWAEQRTLIKELQATIEQLKTNNSQ